MTEARIGRKPAGLSTGEASVVRPELRHQLPRVQRIPEQTQRKPENGLKNSVAVQEAARSVDSVRADISHEAVMPTEKEKRVHRLEELDHEINSSYIPLGTVDSERSELRNKNDLTKLPFLKRIFAFGRTRADIISIDHEDGSRTEYVDRRPRQILLWVANMKPGAYEETYTRDEKGALHLEGRKRVGEHLHYVQEENPENPREVKKSYMISTERTRDLIREKEDILDEVRAENLRERVGDFGAILDGRAIKSAENPTQQRELRMLRMQLNTQINQVYAQSKRKQVTQPEEYTQLSFGDKIRYMGQTIKELVLPNDWKSVGSIALGIGSIGSIDAILLPVSPVVKRIASTFFLGRSMVFGWLMTHNQEKVKRGKQEVVFNLADSFKELQKQRVGTPLIEQAKEFKEILYKRSNRDRYEQLKFRNPELPESELWKRLKRRGLTKKIITGVLPTVASVAAFGLLGYAGVVGIADLIFHVGWSPLGFLPFYNELGGFMHAPAGFAVAYGATAYSLLMQAHNMLARIPDALTTARKKVQLGKEKRETK